MVLAVTQDAVLLGVVSLMVAFIAAVASVRAAKASGRAERALTTDAGETVANLLARHVVQDAEQFQSLRDQIIAVDAKVS